MATDRAKKRWITAGFFFLTGLITASWSSRIPDIQQKLGLGDAAWGTVLAALPLGLVSGMLVSSWLVERYGTKRVMLVSCIVCSLFLCLLGLAPSRALLMTVLYLVGLTRTILNISMNTNSMEVQQLYERPIVSTFHGIWSLACFAALGVGQVMIILEVLPAQHLAIIAAICITAAIVLTSQRPPSAPATAQRRPFLVRPDRYLWMLGVVAFCAMLAESAMFEWSVNYFEKEIKAERSYVTAGLSGFMITMSAGRLVGDRLIHRYGHLNMLIANGLLMSTGFLLAASVPLLLPALLGFLLVGAGDSIIVPIAYTMAAKTKKMQASYAIACVSLIGSAGFVSGPLLMGTLSEVFGMQWAFGFVGTVAVLVTVIAVRLKNTAGKS